MKSINLSPQTQWGAGVAQLVSARLLEQEDPGLIVGESNVCFDFPLIRVAIAVINSHVFQRKQKEVFA